MARKVKKYNIRKEEKLREKERESKKEIQNKKNSQLKPFSIQSALWIIGVSMIGSWLIPVLLSFIGIKTNLGVVIGNTFFTSFGFTWVRHFVDSKEGFSKSFWKHYIIFAVIFGAISYFWLFRKNYI